MTAQAFLALAVFVAIAVNWQRVFLCVCEAACMSACACFIIKAEFATKHVVNNKLAQHGYCLVAQAQPTQHTNVATCVSCHMCACVCGCVCSARRHIFMAYIIFA